MRYNMCNNIIFIGEQYVDELCLTLPVLKQVEEVVGISLVEKFLKEGLVHALYALKRGAGGLSTPFRTQSGYFILKPVQFVNRNFSLSGFAPLLISTSLTSRFFFCSSNYVVSNVLLRFLESFCPWPICSHNVLFAAPIEKARDCSGNPEPELVVMPVSTLGYEMPCSVRAACASLSPSPLGAPSVVDGSGVCPCSTGGTRRGGGAAAKAYGGRGESVVVDHMHTFFK